ncbi:MAG: hypothetical protein IIC91_01315 [Chloroflexi bacterium]|nr:hypothetical protein [Chloroflexota bacterium]
MSALNQQRVLQGFITRIRDVGWEIDDGSIRSGLKKEPPQVDGQVQVEDLNSKRRIAFTLELKAGENLGFEKLVVKPLGDWKLLTGIAKEDLAFQTRDLAREWRTLTALTERSDDAVRVTSRLFSGVLQLLGSASDIADIWEDPLKYVRRGRAKKHERAVEEMFKSAERTYRFSFPKEYVKRVEKLREHIEDQAERIRQYQLASDDKGRWEQFKRAFARLAPWAGDEDIDIVGVRGLLARDAAQRISRTVELLEAIPTRICSETYTRSLEEAKKLLVKELGEIVRAGFAGKSEISANGD